MVSQFVMTLFTLHVCSIPAYNHYKSTIYLLFVLTLYSPGPREIPGCTGSCQRTYCHTCYYSEDAHPRPSHCDRKRCTNLMHYQTNSRCFRRWANCVRRAQRMLQRPVGLRCGKFVVTKILHCKVVMAPASLIRF